MKFNTKAEALAHLRKLNILLTDIDEYLVFCGEDGWVFTGEIINANNNSDNFSYSNPELGGYR